MKNNKVMIVTRGFPASGKTTWAEKWVAEDSENRVNVNRDNIRKMMNFPAIGNKEQENMVTAIAQSVISQAFEQGKSMVISDTNLPAKRVKGFFEMGIDAGYDVQVKDFIVDIDTLIARDSQREDSVGEAVIRKMWSRFPYKSWASQNTMIKQVVDKRKSTHVKFDSVEQNVNMPQAVVFDIDGTIAQMGDRSPYDYSAVSKDTVNENVAEMIDVLHKQGKHIIIFSGREDSCQDDTVKWLNDYGIHFDEIHMRATGDQRKDSFVKRDMIDQFIIGKFYVTQWFDDRDQVVKMVRETFADTPTICFQVNYGDF